MKKFIAAMLLVLCLTPFANATNVVTKGAGFVNVTFDGSNDFDLCAYLGVKNVSLWSIAQNAVAANDTLTVNDGSGGVAIYGPFKDITGGGLLRYYRGQVCKPYVTGSRATAGSKATFECDWVK